MIKNTVGLFYCGWKAALWQTEDGKQQKNITLQTELCKFKKVSSMEIAFELLLFFIDIQQLAVQEI